MSTRTRTPARALLATGLAVATLTGCGFRGASSLPLPGGQGNGSDAYEVTIEFSDVLDLVVQSAVKVNDVNVGSVQEIEATGYTARVVVSVNGDIDLPANTTASLRQTSLLGEKFVSLDAPPESEQNGRLRGGETIGLDQTVRSAEIEEVLSALSLVLNGGSLEQLQVINTEVTAALTGRDGKVKDVLTQLDTFVGGLDQQKGQIVRALESLDKLSTTLLAERETIATALEDVPAGLAVLTEQREELTAVLTALDDLGDVAVRVIDQSKANTIADLRALQPVLKNLADAGTALPRSLELLTTYPFPRTVTEGIKGDYANLFVTADLDLRQLLIAEGVPVPELPSVPLPVPVPSLPPLPGGITPPTITPASPSPSPRGTAPAPGLPGLPLVPRDSPLRVPLGNDGLGLLQLLLGGLS